VHRAGELLVRDVAVLVRADGSTARYAPGPGAKGLAAGALVHAVERRDERAARVHLAELVSSAEELVVELVVEREHLVLGRAGFAPSDASVVHRMSLRAANGERP
jgi:hypothetical protein